MKIQYSKLIFFPIIIMMILHSCSMNSEKQNHLEKENEKLRSEIKALRAKIANDTSLTYRAISITKKNEIKLGEEYEASIFLTVENAQHPYEEIRCNIINNQPRLTKDTLKRSKEDNCFEYRFKPTKTGIHEWACEITRQDIEGIKHRYYLRQKYRVTK